MAKVVQSQTRGSITKTGVMALIAALLLAGCSLLSSFDIKGTWKSVGDEGWGQAQPGAVVIFNGQQTNLYSPRDTYALTKDGDNYTLDITSLMGETITFTVKVIDTDNIELHEGGSSAATVVLKRAQ